MQNSFPTRLEFISNCCFRNIDTACLQRIFEKITPIAEQQLHGDPTTIQELASLDLKKLASLYSNNPQAFTLLRELLDKYYKNLVASITPIRSGIPHEDFDGLTMGVKKSYNRQTKNILYQDYLNDLETLNSLETALEKYLELSMAPVASEDSQPSLFKEFEEAYQNSDIEKCFKLASSMNDETWGKCQTQVESLNNKLAKRFIKINETAEEILKDFNKMCSEAEESYRNDPAKGLKELKALELKIKTKLEKFETKYSEAEESYRNDPDKGLTLLKAFERNINTRYEPFLSHEFEIQQAYRKMASLVNHQPAELDASQLKQFRQLSWKVKNKQVYLIDLIDKLIEDINSRAPNSYKVWRLTKIREEVNSAEGTFEDHLKEIEAICSQRRNFLDFSSPKSLVRFKSLEAQRLKNEYQAMQGETLQPFEIESPKPK